MTIIPKEQPIRDRLYLDSLREARCLFTGLWTSSNETVDPAHVGKRGFGYKESDDCAIPLIHHLHAEQDEIGEASVYRKHAPDDVLIRAFQALARERYRAWTAKHRGNRWR